MAIAKVPPPDDGAPVNRAAGIVRDVGYTGDLYVYRVELDAGATVRVTAPNLTRRTDMPVAWDDRVWITWSPLGGAVLTR
jgi:putrescine transport system ATP-binding protein